MAARLDLAHHVRMQGGQAFVGLAGAAIVLPGGDGEGGGGGGQPEDKDSRQSRLSSSKNIPSSSSSSVSRAGSGLFSVDMCSLDFGSRGALSSYPVASPFTSARHPETFLRLEAEVEQLRAWTNLRLDFRFPAVFGIVLDAEALGGYGRLFSAIMKVGHRIVLVLLLLFILSLLYFTSVSLALSL